VVLLTHSASRRAALGLIAASIILISGAKSHRNLLRRGIPVIAALAAWKQGAATTRLAALVLGTLALGVIAIGFRPTLPICATMGISSSWGPSALGSAGRARLKVSRPRRCWRHRCSPAPSLIPSQIFKWPVTVTRRELISMDAPDPRIGGFGPFFALEAIVALLAVGAVTASRRGRGDPAFISPWA
jgi:hypothetical protein